MIQSFQMKHSVDNEKEEEFGMRHVEVRRVGARCREVEHEFAGIFLVGEREHVRRFVLISELPVEPVRFFRFDKSDGQRVVRSEYGVLETRKWQARWLAICPVYDGKFSLHA